MSAQSRQKAALQKTSCLLWILCNSSTSFCRWLRWTDVRGSHASQVIEGRAGVILGRGIWQGQQCPGNRVSNAREFQVLTARQPVCQHGGTTPDNPPCLIEATAEALQTPECLPASAAQAAALCLFAGSWIDCCADWACVKSWGLISSCSGWKRANKGKAEDSLGAASTHTEHTKSTIHLHAGSVYNIAVHTKSICLGLPVQPVQSVDSRLA